MLSGGNRMLTLFRPGRCLLTALLALMFYAHAVNASGASVEQPDGYRMDFYDSEVPAALDGASTVNAVEVRRLQETAGAVVIDVIPEQRHPEGLPENQIWLPVKHRGIPGAIWLPDTGYGALSEVTEIYFKRHLRAATGANKDHPLVFYCRADCWMSWNAAKRALGYGYTNVHWFSEGTDGWMLESFEFEVLVPPPGERQPKTASE